MNQNSKQPPMQPSFDPFAAPGALSRTSKSWLIATALQALCTCVLLGLAKYAEGHWWERHARLIMLIGIVATWSLALRTIRERLMELMRHWQKASQGLLRKASESGKHWISVPLSEAQERYIKGSIWRLRIIAAGLTIPFFVLPIVWSFIAVFFSMKLGQVAAKDFWVSVAFFTMLSALIVAGYFHWVIVPAPAPVRVSTQTRRSFPQRSRRM